MIATSLRTSEGLTNEVRYGFDIYTEWHNSFFAFHLQIWKEFTTANLYEVFSPDKSKKLREFFKDGLLLLDNR